ncbi:MAG: hypothetical protein R3B54_03700 [Bdellovibrionota bacterium]
MNQRSPCASNTTLSGQENPVDSPPVMKVEDENFREPDVVLLLYAKERAKVVSLGAVVCESDKGGTRL